jgi:hypothetical protein
MNKGNPSRRSFIRKSVASSAILSSGLAASLYADTQIRNPEVEVINPRNRVPVSFIIDDSTALVNMAYYGIPQFKEVFPDQYKQDWRKLPQEIPDDFVREFRDWCGKNGVKGKYSMVPYPACTGWLHRFIPGWTNSELYESLKLVRDTMTPNWDIHPEMISHTRVINTKTGLPFPTVSPDYMENWEWSQKKSADELANYIAYALNVLKEAGFVCEGVTTPGGFGSKNMDNLALGTLEAQKAIYKTEVPHFFRSVILDPDKSVQPELFHVSGLDTDDPRCSVHIIGCTADWFGGWDGLVPGDPDKFITPDLSEGRMVEVIEKQEPAIMVCHWPGIYYNGEKIGFNILKTVVGRIHEKYDNLYWMTLSEISRYWAAKKLTRVEVGNGEVQFSAPFASKEFTIRINKKIKGADLVMMDEKIALSKKNSPLEVENGTYYSNKNESILCFALPKGKSHVILK